MIVGDFVWFKTGDDIFIGENCGDENKLIPGKIMKYMQDSKPPIFWVTPTPILQNSSLPLWAIPTDLVMEISKEEIVLSILEN